MASILTACMILLFSTVTHAQIDVLDHLDVADAEGYSTVRIYLNIPVQLKRFAPEKSGEFIRIFVEPAPTFGAEGDVLFGDETIQWTPNDKVPLSEVTYESSGFASTVISLQFEEEVEFEISPSPDPRQLVITVQHKGAARAVQDIVTTTTARTFPYAINLASSIQTFTAAELPNLDILLTYRVYTTQFDKDGKTWNRLRLGFFSTRQDAETVLEKLLPYFPGAWATPVSIEEREGSADMEMDNR
ncbi:MAG: SPOR domain-containing protein, partial [Gammaproteobacteria bacterium]